MKRAADLKAGSFISAVHTYFTREGPCFPSSSSNNALV